MKNKHTRQITKEQMKVYGQQFRAIRHSLGLNLEIMADLVYVHYKTLGRWERGKHVPQEDIKLLVQRFEDVAARHGGK